MEEQEDKFKIRFDVVDVDWRLMQMRQKVSAFNVPSELLRIFQNEGIDAYMAARREYAERGKI